MWYNYCIYFKDRSRGSSWKKENDKMIKKMGAKTIAILLSVAMVFTMMPLTGIGVQTTHAAELGDGGTVASNSEADAKAAFGLSNVFVHKSGNTLTIELDKDIELETPVKFVKGNTDDTIVLDLNGYDITGANGASSNANENTAKGKDAIQITADEFNVEITDTSTGQKGSVIGGSGTVYAVDLGEAGSMKYAGNGGMAVAFTDSDWSPNNEENNGKLNYGLTVTGGAEIKGGNGAQISGEEWIYNIRNYTGDRKIYSSYKNPMFYLKAGDGAPAIGQTGLSDNAYAKIVVDNGTVTGGSGGIINLNTSNMPVLTHYSLMQNADISSFLREVDKDDAYSNYFANQLRFLPGDGGDGIVIGDGRKYVYVASSGTVEGGSSGNFDYGQSKLVNQYDSVGAGRIAVSGNGMSIYGDVGLTNASPSDSSVTLDNTSSFTEDSNKMGIYVAGTVKGGASPDATAMNEYSGDGGCGIAIDGKFGRQSGWGIIEVGSGGSVLGGTSGNTAYGDVGTSGIAIRELTPKGTDPNTDTPYGTDYYIVNGTVKGGNGGSTQGMTSAGSGQEGMFFDLYRTGLRIYGTGDVIGGDYGTEIDRDQQKNDNRTNAITTGLDPGANDVNINQIKGEPTNYLDDIGKLDVKVSMTSFDTNPTTSTVLSLTGIPEDYTGNVFIMWSATIYRSQTDAGAYDLESSGSDLTSFNILSNESYGKYNDKYYLAYPTYPDNPDINMNNYNANVATVDRMCEADKIKTVISCQVVLADGRWGESNEMTFQKGQGWNGSGSGGDDPSQDDDQQAVDAVLYLINHLPSLSNITLEDEEAVIAAREAYETLTESQKELMSQYYPSALSDLEAAERKIRELKGDEVNDILADIEALCDPDELSLENWTLVEDEANAISEIREKVKALTPEQQVMLASDENAAALAKFEAVDQKIYELVHGVTGSVYHDHLMQCVPEKAATCSTEGNSKYYRCMTCHELYGDQYGGNHITDANSVITAIVPDAHVWDGGVVTKQPAVGVAGERTYTCTVCGEIRTEAIDALPQPQVTPAAPAEIMDLPAVKISKPKAAKKKLTAKWKKVNKKNLKKIGGIEIQVAGPGVDKTVTSGKKSKSKKIGGLQSKQKYSVRVRAYKWIGNTKHVSKWSGWKTVKVK